ncbi:MAG: hypothetical protein LLG14_26425 [Nocardiaceae bacterium]|nr:hypothetical protein [Nocardiaceae bacterium]
MKHAATLAIVALVLTSAACTSHPTGSPPSAETCNPQTIGADLTFTGGVTVEHCDAVWAVATLGEHGDTSWIIRRVDDHWVRYMNLIERRCLSSARADNVPPDLHRYFDAKC